jgi:hypothetical protein
MNMFILDNEVMIRLGCFLGVFIIIVSWEMVVPRRTMTMPRVTRWFNNLLITLLNSVAVKAWSKIIFCPDMCKREGV